MGTGSTYEIDLVRMLQGDINDIKERQKNYDHYTQMYGQQIFDLVMKIEEETRQRTEQI